MTDLTAFETVFYIATILIACGTCFILGVFIDTTDPEKLQKLEFRVLHLEEQMKYKVSIGEGKVKRSLF